MVQTTNNIEDNTLHTLSIQVSLNGLSFCTRDQEDHITALACDHFGIQLTPEQVLDKIKYTFDHHQALKKNFHNIEVIYQNDLYTIVPKALFEEDALKDYLKYNIKVLDNDFIAYDELEQHDMVVVYIPYANINNFFFETFGSFTYKHASTILISSLLAQEKNSEDLRVYANMQDKFFDLVVIHKGRLLLSNTYVHTSKEDFLYYLLFVAEQLKLNPEEFKLVFLGKIEQNSPYFDIAHNYVRNISFGKHQRAPKLSSEINPIPAHQHFVLLSHF